MLCGCFKLKSSLVFDLMLLFCAGKDSITYVARTPPLTDSVLKEESDSCLICSAGRLGGGVVFRVFDPRRPPPGFLGASHMSGYKR